jgi:hypothetical protein
VSSCRHRQSGYLLLQGLFFIVITSFNLSFGVILVLATILVAFHVLVSWSAGRLLLQNSPTLNGLSASFALGHAVLAILIQMLAVAGLLRWHVLLPLFAAILWINLRHSHFPQFEWKRRDWFPIYRLTQVLMFGLALLAVLLALAALSYPGTDALAYYLAQPKLIAATGHYTPLPGYLEAGFAVLPAISEMPYAVMYAIGGEAVGLVAAKLSMWPVFLAVLSLLWQCARGLGLSVDAAWMFVAFGATSTAVTLVAWDGKTDLVGLMYALGAVVWIPGLVSAKPDQRQFWLFGFISACAVMAKLSYALILPFCLGIPLLFLWWKQRAMILRILVIAGLAAFFAFALGWWIKNYFLFGDPFAPVLTLREGTPRFNLEQVCFNVENTRWILTTYPLALTFGLYPMQHGGVSPIWLMLIPALWIRPWQSGAGRKALYLGIGGVVGLLAWALLRPSVIFPRYFLPALILPCLILVAGYERWLSERRAWATVALVAALVLLTVHLEYVCTVYRYVTLPFVSTLKGGIGTTPALDRANRLASDPRPNVKVLLLSYSSEFLPNRMLTSFLSQREIKKDENVLEWALREKVDYIVYDPITHKRGEIDAKPPPGLLMEKLEFAPNVYYLYVLTRTGQDG